MNPISAHKDHLKELLDDLSGYKVVSGITFAALVNAYITRIDTDKQSTYGPDIDSKLHALLRATRNFETVRQVKQQEFTPITIASRSSSQNRTAPDNSRGKPRYLFRGVVK